MASHFASSTVCLAEKSLNLSDESNNIWNFSTFVLKNTMFGFQWKNAKHAKRQNIFTDNQEEKTENKQML